MPPLRSGGGGTAPLTDEELAAAAAPPETAGTYYPPPDAAAPPAPAPQPGLGGVPAPYSASQYYGGPTAEPPSRLNDPSTVVTYYPSTGAAPTAHMTEYAWTQYGRPAPNNFDRPFPAANLLPPPGLTEGGVPPPRPNAFAPGPPRNYIPGSTYIPQDPAPDPRIPYMDRVEQARATHGMASGSVPGAGGPQGADVVSPGLGGGSYYTGGPLSRWGRDAAPTTRDKSNNPYWTVDPREPQDYQPGSTYRPHYVMQPPLGDPHAVEREPSASELYGGPTFAPSDRPKSSARVDTLHPASGAPESTRSTGYLGPNASHSTVYQEGNNPGARIYGTSSTDPLMLSHNPNIPAGGDRALTFWEMERGRQARKPQLRGLFGGS